MNVQNEARRLEHKRWADVDVEDDNAKGEARKPELSRGQRKRQARQATQSQRAQSAQRCAGGKPCQEPSQEADWADELDRRLTAAAPFMDEACGIVEAAMVQLQSGQTAAEFCSMVHYNQLSVAAKDVISKLAWPCKDSVKVARVTSLAFALAGV